MKRFYFVVLFFLCFFSIVIAEDSRIFVDSYINGKPVKLALDTGAEVPILLRHAADRLKLSITEPPSDFKVEKGETKVGWTEKCRFQITEGADESFFPFAVADMPDGLNFSCDGVLGWCLFKNMIIEFNLSLHRIKSHKTLSIKRSEWECMDIRKDLNVLVVKTSSKDTSQDSIFIDTGDHTGLTVRKELWQQLFKDKAEQNTTISATYSPGFGLVVEKEKWVREINFGGLPLRQIPIRLGVILESDNVFTKEGIDGVLGMWAMSCYTWIVDGPAGKIYFRKNDLTRTPEKYDYNRLAAVFVPEDIRTTNSLIVHVLKDGPAYRAGIRDGDELLSVGGLDTTKWRTDPNVMPLSQFWSKPAGSKIDLVLMRDSKKMEISVTLEEIFK